MRQEHGYGNAGNQRRNNPRNNQSGAVRNNSNRHRQNQSSRQFQSNRAAELNQPEQNAGSNDGSAGGLDPVALQAIGKLIDEKLSAVVQSIQAATVNPPLYNSGK